jgi:hypothetical protein
LFRKSSATLFGDSFIAISLDLASISLAAVPAHIPDIQPAPSGTGIIGIDHIIFCAISFSFQFHTGVHLKTVSMTVKSRSQTMAAPNRLINSHPNISLCGHDISKPNAVCFTSTMFDI